MKYRTIVADPPWTYNQKWAGGNTGFGASSAARAKGSRLTRGAGAQYDVMTLIDIEALPVKDWADVDAHLYLWTTNAFMEAALRIARAWGFEQKTILTWVKPRVGLGHYFRNNTEHVLFCVRGSLAPLSTPLRTAYEWEQGRHSEKPAGLYDLAESVSPGPRLDVFARLHRFNWDAWGNEVYCPQHLGQPANETSVTSDGSSA